ncbi:MAG TPA: hypothetical protein VMZ71_05250 [Gemmataceae bacterium]|nr:hypothetical protein [Gemmataceae bacterium]
MLGKAAVRFIRTQWRSVQDFAEECYALFSDDLPLSHSGPITLTPEPGTTAINIVTTDDTTPPITVNGDPLPNSGGGGGTDLGDITWPGAVPGDEDGIPSPADNPISLYGVVVAKVEGPVYNVRVYAKNPLTSPALGVIPVRQMQIDPDDEIPPGTPVAPVIVFPGTVGGVRTVQSAIMQVPVFLEDE